ncbi:MAG: metallophosphoesterase [Bryobacteraceae bacterium]|nr:metallophosphoesterase [Bryobacteraceae bacterium]
MLDLAVLVSCTLAALFLYRCTSEIVNAQWRLWARRAVGFGAFLIWTNEILGVQRIAVLFNHSVLEWTRCAGLVAGGILLYSAAIVAILRTAGAFEPGRRRVLQLAAVAAVAAPVVLGTRAFIRRDDLTFRELDVKIKGLPKDLDGLRIAQLTDIHLSAFLDEATLRRAVGMLNETDPHLTVVTGDLISTKGDPLDTCIRNLAQLRSSSGLWGCLGNHERFAMAEEYTERESARLGLRFLRHQAVPLRFGDSSVNLVGVDYQRRGLPYLVGTESLIDPKAFNILLTHNPDVFPVAARQGFDLTVGGHTHGGQVTLEILHPTLNAARFYTPFTYGLYERGDKQMYVSRGIGTIGVPARLGAPPEVVLLRLCAI